MSSSDPLFSPMEIYAVCAQGISIPIALFLESRRGLKNPQNRPYTWGYYFGCSCLCWSPLALLMLPFCFSEGLMAIGAVAWLLCLGLGGLLVVKRIRSGWVLATVASFNPAFFVIHWLYARNRWQEMKTEEEARRAAKQYVKNVCPACGGSFEFHEQERGREWNCPHCNQPVVLS